MSMWTMKAFLANSSLLPVTRSSKRTPSARSRSHSIDGVVRIHAAVHAEHVEEQRIVAADGAQAHHGRRDGDAGLVDERAQLFAGVRGDDAAAGVNHRPLRLLDRRGDLCDLLRLGQAVLDLVAGQVHRRRRSRATSVAC